MDTLVISIQSKSSDATKAIGKLVSSLKQLRKELDNISVASKGLSNLKVNASVGTHVTARGRSTSGNKRQIPSLEEQLKQYNLKESDLKQIGGTFAYDRNISRFKSVAGDLVTITEKNANGLKTYRVAVKQATKDLPTLSSKFDELKSSMGGVYLTTTAILGTMTLLAKKSADFVKEAGASEEALNLFVVSMGDYAKEGVQWIDKFSKALYLDPVQVQQYMGSFNSLVEGLGVGSDNAYIMSKNLTQLVYDLSSFKNISISSAYEKLMSGISGELEPLRNVGVAMSEATLQNTAYSLGIEKLVRNMTEAEKAQLRYIQIMKSSTEWQTDMGRTLITPTNALRVMQQQFVQLGRAIGKIFIPIIMEMMPYVIALTQMLTALAEKIANFFGYKIADIDYSNLGKISGGIKDIGTSAEGTAAKLQTMLAPFDDLNVVQKSTEGSGGIGGGLGGDLGLDLPQYDALAGLTDKFKNNVEAARKTLEKLLPVVAGIGIAFGTWKIGKSVMSLFNTLKGLGLLGATGGGSAAGGLGISASALGVTAGILAFVTSLAIELPKLSKAFDDVAYYGKNFSDVLKSFKTIDFTILQQLLMQPQGQLGVNILLAAKSFGYLKNETVKSVDVLKVFGKELSKSSKKKLSPLISQFESLNKAIVKVDLSGTISEKDINSIHNKLERISTMIINELDSDRNKQLADLKPLEKYMSTADYQNMLNKTNSYFEQQTGIIKVNSEKISAILDNARNRDGQLQRSEMEEITRLRNEMYETGVRSATENSDEYYKIMSQLKTNLGKLSVEQAGEYIQNAVKTRDESIKAAEEQYSSILAEAYKMKETGQIGETEYKKIVEAAQKAKEESILAAQTQYDEIYKAVVEKLGASGKYIDEETGEIKTNWEVFVDNLKNKWSSGWDKIKTKASDALNRLGGDVLNATNRINGYMEELKRKLERWGVHIKMPHFTWNMNGPSARGVMKKALEALNLPTTLPKLNVSWYKNGGFPTSGELFFANENGIPEMIGKMGNKTAVANNDQIVAGIVNGIQQAFSGFDFGNKSTIVVKIGDKQIYSGYGEYVANENDRYGTNMLKI